MEYIADLHLHSRYAGACSDQLTLENIDTTARQKGIRIIGTGDFTHPLWFKDIKSKLEGDQGLYKLRGSTAGTRFVLSTEVCNIFYVNGKAAKIHNCILSPNIEVAEQINSALAKYGNLASDGRPILTKIGIAELVEILHSIDNDVFVFPAHLWTPWFGALGEFSGFNSIKEAYGDQERHIHAYETGLSSDPAMNWCISALDKYAPISCSDAHSLPKIGREAIVFDFDNENVTYRMITDAITNKKLKLNVEFYPEEGKYHYDGHRNCNISLAPSESRKFNGICPVCRKKLTIGVMHRVEDLADREEGYVPSDSVPFVHAIPLIEVISDITKKAATTAYVKETYANLLKEFGTEFDVLLKSDVERIKGVDKNLGTAIGNIREGRVNIIPGYDGVFGIIDILDEIKKKKEAKQSRINDF